MYDYVMGQPLYGNWRQRKFNDIYPELVYFQEDYDQFKEGIIDNTVSQKGISTIWMLLSARYGNSTVASQNEEQFKMKLFSTIFMYGPTWEKRIDIQKKLRDMKIEDIQLGGKAIFNTALNPSTAVAKDSQSSGGTNTLTELQYINQQNTSNYMKSVPEAYGILLQLLETDVTAEFIERFKKLFLTFVTPELPLWYDTELTQPSALTKRYVLELDKSIKVLVPSEIAVEYGVGQQATQLSLVDLEQDKPYTLIAFGGKYDASVGFKVTGLETDAIMDKSNHYVINFIYKGEEQLQIVSTARYVDNTEVNLLLIGGTVNDSGTNS